MKQIKQIFILALTVIICYQISLSIYRSDQVHNVNVLSNYIQPHNKVVIGVVYCREPKTVLLKDKYFDQTILLLKSVLISAYLFNISTIELHLFLEHVKKDRTYFEKEILEQMTVPGVTVNLQTYSAVDSVPPKYRSHMVYHPRYRCAYVRFFFPEVLPNVDSIIHLDSDMIVTGDLTKHWELLSKMDSHQMVAMAQDTPANDKRMWPTYNFFFGSIPHVKPRGVNAGLLVMNLTRMRKFEMSEKLTRIYDDYSKFTKVLSGQRVINILLYFASDMLLAMPCNLPFMGPECENDKFYCESALKDPGGIHLVHGTSGRFVKKSQVFHPIYQFYKKFDNSTIQNSTNLATNLMQPIKQAYSTEHGNNNTNCYGTLDKVLFKNIL